MATNPEILSRHRLPNIDKYADKAFKELSISFDNALVCDIHLLEVSHQNHDDKKTISLTYGIEKSAGLLGWPLVSRAARSLRYVLEHKATIANPFGAAKTHIEAMARMLKEGMKENSTKGQELLNSLHLIILKYDLGS